MDQKPTDHRIRLNKYLADCGVASRRKADEIIEAGAVTVNGRKVFELGIRIDPKTDKVVCNGKPVTSPHRMVYYAFNKPKNVVTSNSDPQGRPTVLDFFPKEKLRIFPVGRLDWDSEGLLLMTNDGDFANEVMNPKSKITKTYHVKLNSIPTDAQLEKLTRGVSIEGAGKVSAVAVRRLTEKTTETKGWIEIVITEGKNRQVRKMFEKIGHDVTKLRRVAIGELRIGTLQGGAIKVLGAEDLIKIFKIHKADLKDTKKVRQKPKSKESKKVSAYKQAAKKS